MKTKLLLFFTFISFGLFAQSTTHELTWANDGTCANQQITIEVGDTVNWTWGAGSHNLRATNGIETFDSGYQVSSFSHTFNQAGSTDYVCDPHALNMYGTVTVVEASGGSETVIAVWDFNNNSGVGTFDDTFVHSGVTGKTLGVLTNGQADETGPDHDNEVTVTARNGFSGDFLQGLALDPSLLVDGKIHISLGIKNINFLNVNDKFWVYLKSDTGGASGTTTHRLAGIEVTAITSAAGANNLKIAKRIYNNGSNVGISKQVGHLGNTAGWVRDTPINLGLTADYTNQTFNFWVGSPGEYTSGNFGFAWANAANQSTTVATLINQLISDFQFNIVSTAGSSIEIDQIKISTGTYENTVASGDVETPSFTAPSWAGNWLIDPAAGALAVGPSQGSGQWFATSENTATERACLYDDVYTFGEDGSFTNTLQGQTWLETWQGVAEGCGTPLAPHDGSNAATYTYDETTVTLNGLGAYLGIAKAFNLGELSNPAEAVSTITYLITEVNENYLTLDIEVGGGNWWRFRLIKEGYTPPPPATYNVTFNVDMNNLIVPDAGVYAGGGVLGDATAQQMTDADGDGIWTVTIEMTEGTTGDYIFLNGPGDGGDWNRKEQLAGQDCGQGANNDRLLPPVTADATYSFCFGTCQADCGEVTRYDVTFNVDTNNIEVGANGMTIGGGIMGGANAFAMTDADADGVYTRTVSMPAGTTGNYVFLNNTSNHYSYNGKEDLNGQDCADANNNNDRILDSVTGPTTISYCYATCETSCSTAGLDDLGMSQFTYYPNPVNDQLTIRAQSNVKEVTVFNMLGQVVIRQSPNAKDCLVDMAVMQSGAYFVQIAIGNTVETVRVLKQ